MGRRLTRTRAGGVVGALFVAAIATASPAAAQTTGDEPGQRAICVIDAGVIDVDSGNSGQGIETGDLIWRVSYQAQRVTALDPESLSPVIDKQLGQTSAAVLTPLSEVGELIAVPISGPGKGAVQFLDAHTGDTVATIGLGTSATVRRRAFQLVTAVVTIGNLAYVASGDHLTVIDIDSLVTTGDDRSVVERIPIDHTIAELGVVDDTLVLRELMSSRMWSLGASDLEAYEGPVPWSSVEVGDSRFALVGDSVVRLGDRRDEPIEVPVIGRPTAVAASADSLWVASRSGDTSFVSLVDPVTDVVTATVIVDGPIWWLWATSDTAFVETPDEALALTASLCGT